MPKPNYGFEKRQRELEKKRKKADKAQRKSAPPSQQSPDADAPREGVSAETEAAPKESAA